jgi:hypothetical protein
VSVNRDSVLAALSRHVGHAAGVSVDLLTAEIVGALFADEGAQRAVRKVVSALREEGVAVCAHPRTGYYIAETAAELEECCAFLRSRAMHSLTLESRLRKIALGELLGQIRLQT